jgi:hypothetical protein
MVPRIFLERCNRSGQLSDVKDIVDAIIYLTEVGQVVTGEVLHVDGGAEMFNLESSRSNARDLIVDVSALSKPPKWRRLTLGLGAIRRIQKGRLAILLNRGRGNP